jgi:hypothetical protein
MGATTGMKVASGATLVAGVYLSAKGTTHIWATNEIFEYERLRGEALDTAGMHLKRDNMRGFRAAISEADIYRELSNQAAGR